MSDSEMSSSANSDDDSGEWMDVSSCLIKKSPFRAENYAYIRSIVDTLNSVTIPGSFASGGPFQFSAPALKIIGVEGYVGVPVCDCQAKAIKAVCAQAPFGRGQETIVDTTVRNTWELDPSQFTITNPQWSSQLENLATVVKKELGCDPKLSVKCELYKFLLYEQGSFFKVNVHTIHTPSVSLCTML